MGGSVAEAERRAVDVQRRRDRSSTSPCSSTIRSASMRRTWPSLTTSSIWRSASSSWALSIVPRIHRRRLRSDRCARGARRPRAGRRGRRGPSACAAASASSAMPSMIPPTCSSGWNAARSRNQASRGRTHRIRSGVTPLSRSHMQASTAVLPDPSTVNDDVDPAAAGSSLTGTTRARRARSRRTECAWPAPTPRGSARRRPCGGPRPRGRAPVARSRTAHRRSRTDVLVAGEDADPAGPREALGRLGEVLADLLAGRALVEAGVLAGVVDAIVTERQRADAVVRGRDVQADERDTCRASDRRRRPGGRRWSRRRASPRPARRRRRGRSRRRR